MGLENSIMKMDNWNMKGNLISGNMKERENSMTFREFY